MGAAVAILCSYPDLRAADLPALSKAALRSLSGYPEAVRDLAAAGVSPSPSVRRFARKFLPKAGPGAGGAMLLVAAECLDPMKPAAGPGDSLVGVCFHGYTNPLGASIRAQGLGFDPPKPPFAYSEAERFARNVLENVLFMLSSANARLYVRFMEYCEALQPNFRYAESVELPRPWPHAELYLPGVAAWEGGLLLAKSPAMLEAAQAWSQFRMLLDEPQEEPAAEALRQRLLTLPEVNREAARRSLRLKPPSNVYNMSKSDRLEILALLDERRASAYGVDDQFFEKYFKEFLERHPGELEASRAHLAARACESATPAVPAKSRRGKAAAGMEPPSPAELAADPFVPSQPSVEEASSPRSGILDGLLDLAGSLGLSEFRRDLSDRLGSRVPEFPQGSGMTFPEWIASQALSAGPPRPDPDEEVEVRWTAEPGDEALLRAVVETVGVGGSDRVPEADLRRASWQRPLADLLLRLGARDLEEFRRHSGPDWEWKPFDETPADRAYWGLRDLVQVGSLLLDEEGLDRLGDLVRPFRFDFDVDRDMLRLLEKRALQPARLLEAVFPPRGTQALADQPFQCALARLYARPEPEARARARAMVARIELPRGGEHYRRKDCNDPYRWVCWSAWQRRDSELLAHAFEKCALSYHTKGKPTLPEAPPVLAFDLCAPSQREVPGVPLEEVWAFVRGRHPQRVVPILRSLLGVAELEDLPRVLLRVAASVAPEDLDGVREEILSLLEASQAPAQGAALEAVRRRPGLAAGREEDVLRTAGRLLASPSSSVVQEAAAAVSALGQAFPALAGEAWGLLGGALSLDTAKVLEQVIKSLRELRSAGAPGTLDGATVARLQELAKQDARRFERPVRQLLGP